MEKFCQHIEKLLAHHDYVVVPNLGGFVVQTQSAQFKSDCILPPLSTIGFNPLMHHADGLLAIEIARSAKMSYRMAMQYIEKEVEKLKSNVQSSGNIEFGNLGSFYQNEQGNILFTPLERVSFLPQNFELSTLYISPKSIKLKNEKPKIIITLPSTRLFKYASVAMLIVGLFCISPRVNDMRQLSSADIATSAFYNTSKVDVLTNITVKKKISVENIISKDSDSFHVIVASLPNQTIADKFCKELASDFPTAHVLSSAKKCKVAIKSFSQRDNAIKFMENLRKTDSRFETAWVLCN